MNWKKIETAAQCWASHSSHSLRRSWAGGPLSSLGRKWPRHPAAHDAGRRRVAFLRGHRARRGAVARCPPTARWPRWKVLAGVSTDVERWTCRARRQGRGLTEEVAQWWGGRENLARRRSMAGNVQTVVGVAPRNSRGSARVRER
jgi:hypothetical protein